MSKPYLINPVIKRNPFYYHLFPGARNYFLALSVKSTLEERK